jgi:hypothetical protein
LGVWGCDRVVLLVPPIEGSAPLDFVEDKTMPVHQGGLKEEPFCKSRLDAANGLPIGGAEVGSECKADPEEPVLART